MTKLQDIQKDTLFPVVVNEKSLTTYGIDLVYRWLSDRRLNFQFWTVVGTQDVAVVEYDDEKYQGKLVNRIQQYLSKTVYPVYPTRTLTPSDLKELSDLIAANMFGGDSLQYYIDVVNRIDWNPGDFKEKTNSCWWGSFKTGRYDFEKEMALGEAAAIRLFRSATEAERKARNILKWYDEFIPMGRCFALVNNPDDVDIIFNGYGIELLEWKNLLVSTLDYKYSGKLSGSLSVNRAYVNNSTGYPLSDKPISIRSYYATGFGQYPLSFCPSCGAKHRIAEKFQGYCSECFDRLFVPSLEPDGPSFILRTEAEYIQFSDGFYSSFKGYAPKHLIEEGLYRKCQHQTCGNFFRDRGSRKLCPQHRKQPEKRGYSTSSTTSTYYSTIKRL